MKQNVIQNLNFEEAVINEEEKEYISKSGTIARYHKGDMIFSEGDAADRIYYIDSGFVKIFRIDSYGKKVTVGSIRSPGELMGLAETLFHGDRTCFASAINDVTMVVIREAAFKDLLTKYPSIAIKVATTLAIRMRDAEQMIEEMVCLPAPGRLAMLLIKMSIRAGVETANGTKIDFRLTHEEIAYMIGSTRQTVTSLLNAFKNENSIAIEDKELYIRDVDKLIKWFE